MKQSIEDAKYCKPRQQEEARFTNFNFWSNLHFSISPVIHE